MNDTLTPEQIRDRVSLIKSMSHDPKAAALAERQLHIDVLLAIEAGATEDTSCCAFVAASTMDIEFLNPKD